MSNLELSSCSQFSIFEKGPTSLSCSSGDLSPPQPASKCSKNTFSPLTCPWRRRSSEWRLQRVLNALVPFRLRGRSKSVSDLAKNSQLSSTAQRLHTSDNIDLIQPSVNNYIQASRTVPIVHPMGLYQYSVTATNSEEDLTALPPLLASHIYRLDHDLSEPDISLRELRRKWPKAFTNLVASYLSFLEFEADDLFRIAEEVGKNESKRMARAVIGSPITRSVFTPNRFSNRLASWGSGKAQREEIAQWYTIVFTMINYLLENNRYCKKFIFRRPGVLTQVNELEKTLFSQKGNNNFKLDNLDDTTPSSSVEFGSNICDILAHYDVLTIATTLTRVLRRHGSLIPRRLHYLFTQLADEPGDAAIHSSSLLCVQANRRRALRLLLQLTPSRHLSLVYRPLCHLLTKITAEPICEVDDCSLAVLFAPVFLLDRDVSTPASLANPKLPQIVRLLLELSIRELASVGANAQNILKVPRLFLYDCHRNLVAHEESEDPPLYCSLRYCATMTNRQPCRLQSSGLPRKRSASTDTLTSVLQTTPLTRIGSKVANKRQALQSISSPPKMSLEETVYIPTTPIIKRPLHSAQLNFRIRRTPYKTNRNKINATTPLTPLPVIGV